MYYHIISYMYHHSSHIYDDHHIILCHHTMPSYITIISYYHMLSYVMMWYILMSDSWRWSSHVGWYGFWSCGRRSRVTTTPAPTATTTTTTTTTTAATTTSDATNCDWFHSTIITRWWYSPFFLNTALIHLLPIYCMYISYSAHWRTIITSHICNASSNNNITI